MQAKNIFRSVLLLLLPLCGHAQAWKWANSLGSANSNTTIKSIRPYTGTDVLVSGNFAASTLNLGNLALNNAGQDDGYVAIVNDAGQYIWANEFGGSGRDFTVDAAAASNGDFVVVGNFASIFINIDGTNLANSGETDAFVAKYKQDKSLAWAQKIGTADIDEVNSVVLDADGNTYVSGHVHNKFTFTTLHVFLRKYNAAGGLVWEKKGVAQAGYLQATALTLDKNQNIYLGGTVSGSGVFDGTTITSNEGYGAFIVKYSPSGAMLDTVTNLELDKYNGLQAHENHIYACAEKVNWGWGWGWPLADSKIHVLKFDLDLNTVWQKSAGGDSIAQSLDIAKSISVDELGNAYVTGYFFGESLHFANQTLPNLFHINYFYPQIFVFKYGPSGEELWGKSFGEIHTDEAVGIHAFGDDQFYLGGNFESNPISFGTHQLHNTGTLDSFYVHLKPVRYGRKPMGFLAVFDKNVSSTQPEPAFESVSVFPNPVTEYVTVQLKAPAHSSLIFQLHASDGRLIRQRTYADQISELREDLRGMPPGLYFLTLRTESGVFSAKMVKQ